MSGNRRKGQAASSARAAELLQASGLNLPFINLEGANLVSNDLNSSGNVEQLIENMGLNVDPQMQIIFKKLTKKDVQTREKAVKELLLEVQNSKNDADKLKNAFPSFVAAYPGLVTDASSTIRANTNAILSAFTLAVKKEAAKDLKTIFPFLLFSTKDGYQTVANSANTAVNDICASPENRQTALNKFANDTAQLCLDIMARKHKLIQPQKFAEIENDAERQVRLIAQAINALTEFVESVPGLSDSVAASFVNSTSFSNLMNMNDKVKAAAFNLLKVFLKAKPSSITGTRIPSFILKELDSKDTLLCRNAFECFLIAANDDSFYETVKIEKAVVPKFVTLVRKKHLHWHVLETSLLPSVSVIYDHLPSEEQKKKWLMTVLDCFFDEINEGLLLSPWVNAFSEVYRFAYNKGYSALSEHLSQALFKFLDIVIPFDDDQTKTLVVDLILWVDSKLYDIYDESEAFKQKLITSLAKGLPRATKILEAFFEDSPDQVIMTDLLLLNEIPNDVFLRCFRLIDEDVVDLGKFGDIFKDRIIRETDYNVSLNLMKGLWALIIDGNIDGHLPYYADFNNPRIARLVVEIADKDVVADFDDRAYKLLTVNALNDCFRSTLLSPKVLANFFALARDPANLAAVILQTIESNGEAITLNGFLAIFEAVFAPGNEDVANVAGRSLFVRLFGLYFVIYCENDESAEHSDASEWEDALASIKKAAGDNFGPKFNTDWTSSMLRQIDDNEHTISVKSIKRMAALLGALKIDKEAYFELLPSAADVERLFGQINQQFAFDILATSSKSRFQPALITISALTPMTPLDLRHLTRKAVFYGRLAEAFESNYGETEIERAALSAPLFYAILIEAAIGMQANRSMFSQNPDHGHALTFQELLNFIDRSFDSPNYDYREFLASPPASAYLFALALNETQIAKIRPHVAVVATPSSTTTSSKTSGTSDLLAKLETADAAGTEAAVEFLETHVAEHRAEFEDWLFNVDSNQERTATSAAFLRILAKLIGEGAQFTGDVHDFLLCGFVCAMQSITDAFGSLEPGTRVHDFTALMAYFCLEISERYEARVNSGDATTNVLEWRDFFRSAALSHIAFWIAAIDPERKLSFPPLFINKLCDSAMKLTAIELAENGLPKALIGSSGDPMKLSWNDYDGDVSAVLKLALRFIFDVHETDEAAKHLLGIFILKSHLMDMYCFENPPRTPRSPTSLAALNLEEQLFDPSVNEQKRLPALFRVVFSREETQLNLHHKFFIWDSLVQFLSALDIQTRAKYAASVDVPVINNLLALLFNALPRDLVAKYKLFSFKGALSIRQLITTPLSFHSVPNGTTLEHYLINLFYRTTICLPSCVREWYLELRKNQSQEVSTYVKLLAPIITERELNSVGSVKNGRLTVRALDAVKEVVATYRFEEANLALKITLPEDYPFSFPTIETQRAIVNVNLLRKWLKQLTSFLKLQNGLMLDGILQWKRSIDNHLEGIEDCSICMSTVSALNYTLPQLQCRECRKKFHGHCLYKWFETSNVPSCPMCRHTFYN